MEIIISHRNSVRMSLPPKKSLLFCSSNVQKNDKVNNMLPSAALSLEFRFLL